MYFEEDRDTSKDIMQGAYLGPSFSKKEVNSMNRKVKAVFHEYDDFSVLSNDIAVKIAEGNVIGWFQGKMEFGPRALGNRSILGDPSNPEMQKKLNLKIKYREGFRPFAPSVLLEDASQYFNLNSDSPYMLIVSEVHESLRKVLPENYESMSLWEKLYCQRSELQSITHLDFSARIQTVHQSTNHKYWKLIDAFKKKTGYGLLINTSFNVRGEPIVCTPYDAFRCFMATEMDYLVINNFVYIKTEQLDWQDKNKWNIKFVLD